MMELQKLQEQKNAYMNESNKRIKGRKPYNKIYLFIYNIKTYTGECSRNYGLLCLPLSLLFFLFLRFS